MPSPLALEDFYRIADALHERVIVDAYALRWAEADDFEAVHLTLDSGHCRISANPDTDEIHIDFRSDDLPGAAVNGPLIDRDTLSIAINQRIGWSWTCYNSQGYRDAVMISLSGVAPTLIFYAIASSVRVGRLPELLK